MSRGDKNFMLTIVNNLKQLLTQILALYLLKTETNTFSPLPHYPVFLQVQFRPFSPQFTDPRLYMWNVSGDGMLLPVPGVKLQTRPSQCTDFLTIQSHLRLFASTGASHYRFALNWSLVFPQGDLSGVNKEALRYELH